ncbi:hypothetical protein KCP75_08260 [Salmonella enterica subsp. enterica]|nr:hypothetical protein KCP75_08260 [Salmonella enterica subsp. enterica]
MDYRNARQTIWAFHRALVNWGICCEKSRRISLSTHPEGTPSAF